MSETNGNGNGSAKRLVLSWMGAFSALFLLIAGTLFSTQGEFSRELDAAALSRATLAERITRCEEAVKAVSTLGQTSAQTTNERLKGIDEKLDRLTKDLYSRGER